LRRSFLPRSVSSRTGSNVSSATSTGSPFPPLPSAYREETPSPYVPATALTSTPHTVQSKALGRSVSDQTRTTFTQSSSHQRTRSGTGELGSSTATGRERWQTPGQMSRSFSIDGIKMDGAHDDDQGSDDAYQVPFPSVREKIRLTLSHLNQTHSSQYRHLPLSVVVCLLGTSYLIAEAKDHPRTPSYHCSRFEKSVYPLLLPQTTVHLLVATY